MYNSRKNVLLRKYFNKTKTLKLGLQFSLNFSFHVENSWVFLECSISHSSKTMVNILKKTNMREWLIFIFILKRNILENDQKIIEKIQLVDYRSMDWCIEHALNRIYPSIFLKFRFYVRAYTSSMIYWFSSNIRECYNERTECLNNSIYLGISHKIWKSIRFFDYNDLFIIHVIIFTDLYRIPQNCYFSSKMFIFLIECLHLLLHFYARSPHPHSEFFLKLPHQHCLFLQ